MHKLYLALVFVCIFLGSVFVGQSVGASSSGVISQVQTRSLAIGGSASEELVEIYNNSDSDVNVTNWCLKYGSADNPAPTKNLVCINSVTPIIGLHIFLPKRSSAVFVSQIFANQNPSFGFDKIMASGMSDDENRWVSLVDGSTVLDTLEWGNSAISSTAEGGAEAPIPTTSKLLQRKMIKPDNLQDTNNNFNDFELATARTIYSYGALYDMQDVCFNIDSIQEIPPDGSVVDSKGNCLPPVVDICKDIDGTQTDLLKYKPDINNNCIVPPVDTCPNLTDVQASLPDKYKLVDGKCMLDLLSLKITELLPDAVGSDSGGEFIEIYNPNNVDVDLSLYVLSIGIDGSKSYKFPTGSLIKPNSYLVFYNNEISFTLVNSSSMVAIMTEDGQLIDKSPVYNDPKEGEAWTLVDGTWQYTNQLTPGEINLPSLVEADIKVVVPSSTLQPCKDGQYRSEETNRCRNIISDVADLALCAEGQERNPATNRCRSITTAVLGDSTLKPCDPGQERNPDTNRCRNVVSAIPQANYAPEQVSSSSNNNMTWWIVAAVGAVAVGYGVWEWRQELVGLTQKIGSFLRRKK